jgi:hypothetical protein
MEYTLNEMDVNALSDNFRALPQIKMLHEISLSALSRQAGQGIKRVKRMIRRIMANGYGRPVAQTVAGCAAGPKPPD